MNRYSQMTRGTILILFLAFQSHILHGAKGLQKLGKKGKELSLQNLKSHRYSSSRTKINKNESQTNALKKRITVRQPDEKVNHFFKALQIHFAEADDQKTAAKSKPLLENEKEIKFEDIETGSNMVDSKRSTSWRHSQPSYPQKEMFPRSEEDSLGGSGTSDQYDERKAAMTQRIEEIGNNLKLLASKLITQDEQNKQMYANFQTQKLQQYILAAKAKKQMEQAQIELNPSAAFTQPSAYQVQDSIANGLASAVASIQTNLDKLSAKVEAVSGNQKGDSSDTGSAVIQGQMLQNSYLTSAVDKLQGVINSLTNKVAEIQSSVKKKPAEDIARLEMFKMLTNNIGNLQDTVNKLSSKVESVTSTGQIKTDNDTAAYKMEAESTSELATSIGKLESAMETLNDRVKDLSTSQSQSARQELDKGLQAERLESNSKLEGSMRELANKVADLSQKFEKGEQPTTTPSPPATPTPTTSPPTTAANPSTPSSNLPGMTVSPLVVNVPAARPLQSVPVVNVPGLGSFVEPPRGSPAQMLGTNPTLQVDYPALGQGLTSNAVVQNTPLQPAFHHSAQAIAPMNGAAWGSVPSVNTEQGDAVLHSNAQIIANQVKLTDQLSSLKNSVQTLANAIVLLKSENTPNLFVPPPVPPFVPPIMPISDTPLIPLSPPQPLVSPPVNIPVAKFVPQVTGALAPAPQPSVSGPLVVPPPPTTVPPFNPAPVLLAGRVLNNAAQAFRKFAAASAIAQAGLAAQRAIKDGKVNPLVGPNVGNNVPDGLVTGNLGGSMGLGGLGGLDAGTVLTQTDQDVKDQREGNLVNKSSALRKSEIHLHKGMEDHEHERELISNVVMDNPDNSEERISPSEALNDTLMTKRSRLGTLTNRKEHYNEIVSDLIQYVKEMPANTDEHTYYFNEDRVPFKFQRIKKDNLKEGRRTIERKTSGAPSISGLKHRLAKRLEMATDLLKKKIIANSMLSVKRQNLTELSKDRKSVSVPKHVSSKIRDLIIKEVKNDECDLKRSPDSCSRGYRIEELKKALTKIFAERLTSDSSYGTKDRKDENKKPDNDAKGSMLSSLAAGIAAGIMKGSQALVNGLGEKIASQVATAAVQSRVPFKVENDEAKTTPLIPAAASASFNSPANPLKGSLQETWTKPQENFPVPSGESAPFSPPAPDHYDAFETPHGLSSSHLPHHIIEWGYPQHKVEESPPLTKMGKKLAGLTGAAMQAHEATENTAKMIEENTWGRDKTLTHKGEDSHKSIPFHNTFFGSAFDQVVKGDQNDKNQERSIDKGIDWDYRLYHGDNNKGASDKGIDRSHHKHAEDMHRNVYGHHTEYGHHEEWGFGDTGSYGQKHDWENGPYAHWENAHNWGGGDNEHLQRYGRHHSHHHKKHRTQDPDESTVRDFGYDAHVSESGNSPVVQNERAPEYSEYYSTPNSWGHRIEWTDPQDLEKNYDILERYHNSNLGESPVTETDENLSKKHLKRHRSGKQRHLIGKMVHRVLQAVHRAKEAKKNQKLNERNHRSLNTASKGRKIPLYISETRNLIQHENEESNDHELLDDVTNRKTAEDHPINEKVVNMFKDIPSENLINEYSEELGNEEAFKRQPTTIDEGEGKNLRATTELRNDNKPVVIREDGSATEDVAENPVTNVGDVDGEIPKRSGEAWWDQTINTDFEPQNGEMNHGVIQEEDLGNKKAHGIFEEDLTQLDGLLRDKHQHYEGREMKHAPHMLRQRGSDVLEVDVGGDQQQREEESHRFAHRNSGYPHDEGSQAASARYSGEPHSEQYDDGVDKFHERHHGDHGHDYQGYGGMHHGPVAHHETGDTKEMDEGDERDHYEDHDYHGHSERGGRYPQHYTDEGHGERYNEGPREDLDHHRMVHDHSFDHEHGSPHHPGPNYQSDESRDGFHHHQNRDYDDHHLYQEDSAPHHDDMHPNHFHENVHGSMHDNDYEEEASHGRKSHHYTEGDTEQRHRSHDEGYDDMDHHEDDSHHSNDEHRSPEYSSHHDDYNHHYDHENHDHHENHDDHEQNHGHYHDSNANSYHRGEAEFENDHRHFEDNQYFHRHNEEQPEHWRHPEENQLFPDKMFLFHDHVGDGRHENGNYALDHLGEVDRYAGLPRKGKNYNNYGGIDDSFTDENDDGYFTKGRYRQNHDDSHQRHHRSKFHRVVVILHGPGRVYDYGDKRNLKSTKSARPSVPAMVVNATLLSPTKPISTNKTTVNISRRSQITSKTDLSSVLKTILQGSIRREDKTAEFRRNLSTIFNPAQAQNHSIPLRKQVIFLGPKCAALEKRSGSELTKRQCGSLPLTGDNVNKVQEVSNTFMKLQGIGNSLNGQLSEVLPLSRALPQNALQMAAPTGNPLLTGLRTNNLRNKLQENNIMFDQKVSDRKSLFQTSGLGLPKASTQEISPWEFLQREQAQQLNTLLPVIDPVKHFRRPNCEGENCEMSQIRDDSEAGLPSHSDIGKLHPISDQCIGAECRSLVDRGGSREDIALDNSEHAHQRMRFSHQPNHVRCHGDDCEPNSIHTEIGNEPEPDISSLSHDRHFRTENEKLQGLIADASHEREPLKGIEPEMMKKIKDIQSSFDPDDKSMYDVEKSRQLAAQDQMEALQKAVSGSVGPISTPTGDFEENHEERNDQHRNTEEEKQDDDDHHDDAEARHFGGGHRGHEGDEDHDGYHGSDRHDHPFESREFERIEDSDPTGGFAENAKLLDSANHPSVPTLVENVPSESKFFKDPINKKVENLLAGEHIKMGADDVKFYHGSKGRDEDILESIHNLESDDRLEGAVNELRENSHGEIERKIDPQEFHHHYRSQKESLNEDRGRGEEYHQRSPPEKFSFEESFHESPEDSTFRAHMAQEHHPVTHSEERLHNSDNREEEKDNFHDHAYMTGNKEDEAAGGEQEENEEGEGGDHDEEHAHHHHHLHHHHFDHDDHDSHFGHSWHHMHNHHPPMDHSKEGYEEEHEHMDDHEHDHDHEHEHDHEHDHDHEQEHESDHDHDNDHHPHHDEFAEDDGHHFHDHGQEYGSSSHFMPLDHPEEHKDNFGPYSQHHYHDDEVSDIHRPRDSNSREEYAEDRADRAEIKPVHYGGRYGSGIDHDHLNSEYEEHNPASFISGGHSHFFHGTKEGIEELEQEGVGEAKNNVHRDSQPMIEDSFHQHSLARKPRLEFMREYHGHRHGPMSEHLKEPPFQHTPLSFLDPPLAHHQDPDINFMQDSQGHIHFANIDSKIPERFGDHTGIEAVQYDSASYPNDISSNHHLMHEVHDFAAPHQENQQIDQHSSSLGPVLSSIVRGESLENNLKMQSAVPLTFTGASADSKKMPTIIVQVTAKKPEHGALQLPAVTKKVNTGYPVYQIPHLQDNLPIIPEFIKPAPPAFGPNPYEILTSDMLNPRNYGNFIKRNTTKYFTADKEKGTTRQLSEASHGTKATVVQGFANALPSENSPKMDKNTIYRLIKATDDLLKTSFTSNGEIKKSKLKADSQRLIHNIALDVKPSRKVLIPKPKIGMLSRAKNRIAKRVKQRNKSS